MSVRRVPNLLMYSDGINLACETPLFQNYIHIGDGNVQCACGTRNWKRLYFYNIWQYVHISYQLLGTECTTNLGIGSILQYDMYLTLDLYPSCKNGHHLQTELNLLNGLEVENLRVRILYYNTIM